MQKIALDKIQFLFMIKILNDWKQKELPQYDEKHL